MTCTSPRCVCASRRRRSFPGFTPTLVRFLAHSQASRRGALTEYAPSAATASFKPCRDGVTACSGPAAGDDLTWCALPSRRALSETLAKLTVHITVEPRRAA